MEIDGFLHSQLHNFEKFAGKFKGPFLMLLFPTCNTLKRNRPWSPVCHWSPLPYQYMSGPAWDNTAAWLYVCRLAHHTHWLEAFSTMALLLTLVKQNVNQHFNVRLRFNIHFFCGKVVAFYIVNLRYIPINSTSVLNSIQHNWLKLVQHPRQNFTHIDHHLEQSS